MGKELSVKTDDKFILRGFIHYPDERKEKYPLIIFAHQFGTTHVIWSDFAKLALSSYLNPVLYVSSVNDPIGSTKHALWYEKNSNNSTLFIFPSKGHRVVLLKKYSRYILQFLKSLE